MDNLFANIVSNIWYALVALLIISIVLHLFLVYPKNLSKKQWKRVDYIWIELTAVGLIGTTNNVRLVLNKNQLLLTYPRLASQIKYINSFLSPEGSKIVCRTSVKTEYSPSNFDEIVKDDNNACEWSKKIYQIIKRIDTAAYTSVNMSEIPPLETSENIWFKGVILDNINKYNSLVLDKENCARQIDDLNKDTFLVFSPLLLILGLAIRLTKVTGELMHEK